MRFLPSRCIGFALVVLVVALPGGCASDKFGPPKTSWDDDRPTVAPAAASAPPAAAAPEGAKKTAASVATGKSSADACMENAEKIGGDQGVSLVRECMHRSDFLDLKRAVREPWLPKMRSSA